MSRNCSSFDEKSSMKALIYIGLVLMITSCSVGRFAGSGKIKMVRVEREGGINGEEPEAFTAFQSPKTVTSPGPSDVENNREHVEITEIDKHLSENDYQEVQDYSDRQILNNPHNTLKSCLKSFSKKAAHFKYFVGSHGAENLHSQNNYAAKELLFKILLGILGIILFFLFIYAVMLNNETALIILGLILLIALIVAAVIHLANGGGIRFG